MTTTMILLPSDVVKLEKGIDDLLSSGFNFNTYMWHGGTNFGLTSGNQFGGKFNPTSYDYNAPQAESGNSACVT